MFYATNYSRPDTFTPAYGVGRDDDGRFIAFTDVNVRDQVLRELRDGSLSWSGAVAQAYDRHEYRPDAHWTGSWAQVHEPAIDDAVPDSSPIPDTVPRHELERANERVEQLQRELAAARAEITDVNDERLTPIWDRAAEVATEEGFCPEYDRLANGLGIPGRERLYRGVVTVTFNVYAYARSRDRSVAEEEMEETVREAVRNINSGTVDDGSITHVDFERVETDDVDVYA